ncbi:hypothetical protein COLO4_14554 [Corchorus olitorius]|uniref:RNase H type-1 domain-containing protein n=1 Tax=Corchorus olitorius TaxID=93759 RepID=A0A1R3JSA2_9ROSI|nr:hypothetical protein COLO4_14554 [Corchorus olitorius]
MGCRDFNMFNKALLAKQAYCILSAPNFLCVKILKGVYFPNASFLNTGVPRTSSWAWRSIHDGLQVLKDGLGWNISRGREVQIWNDAWRQWRLDVIHRAFAHSVAKAILKVHIGSLDVQDKLIWHFTNDGTYTVKSGYRFLKSRDVPTRTPITSSNTHGVWKTIGICRGGNYRAHYYLLSIFLNGLASIQFQLHPREGFVGFKDCWDEVASTIPDFGQFHTIGLVDFLCWSIWKAMNLFLFEGVEGDPLQKPPPRIIKMNCDASFDRKLSKAGIATVCRDSNGQLIDGASMLVRASSAEMAEAFAIRLASGLAKTGDGIRLLLNRIAER